MEGKGIGKRNSFLEWSEGRSKYIADVLHRVNVKVMYVKSNGLNVQVVKYVLEHGGRRVGFTKP